MKKGQSSIKTKKSVILKSPPLLSASTAADEMTDQSGNTTKRFGSGTQRAKSAVGLLKTSGTDVSNPSFDVMRGFIEKLDHLVVAHLNSGDDLVESVEVRHLVKSIFGYTFVLIRKAVIDGKFETLSEGPVDKLPKVFANICRNWLRADKVLSDKSQHWWAYYLGIIAMDWTNADESFCKAVVSVADDFLNYSYEILANRDLQAAFDTNDEARRLLESFLSIGHNIARIAELRPKLAERNYSEVLRFYLKCPDQDCQCTALMFMAAIASDKESSSLNDEFGIIPTLTKYLQSSFDNEYHECSGFSTEELMQGVNLIIANDDNKAKFVASGLIPILSQILERGNENEQSRAVECLWNLAFGENERKKILENPAVLAILKKLTKSSNATLRMKATKAVNVVENGKTHLTRATSAALERRQNADEKGGANLDEDGGHIFISYSWKNQETCKKIRDLLKANKFRTWMDIDEMSGSTLDAMARAIETAKLILICYSDFYRQSPNCRTEAEYVFQLQKPFVPVKMQHQYRPDGWLAIMIGSKLYVDMSLSAAPFHEVAPKLVNQVKSVLQLPSMPSGPSANAQQVPPPVSIATAKSAKDESEEFSASGNKKLLQVAYVRSKTDTWSPGDVVRWLNKNGLTNEEPITNFLKDMNGQHLGIVFEMKVMAPDLFHSTLFKSLNGSVSSVAKFIEALDRLH